MSLAPTAMAFMSNDTSSSWGEGIGANVVQSLRTVMGSSIGSEEWARTDVFQSLHQISDACKELEGAAMTDFLEVVGFQHQEGAEELLKSCHWLNSLLASPYAQAFQSSQEVIERNLQQDEFPWFAEVTADHYPWVNILVMVIILFATVTLWETFWTKSTMCLCLTKPCKGSAASKAASKAVEDKKVADSWGGDGRLRMFWEGVTSWHAQYLESRYEGGSQTQPYVLFSRRIYRVMSGSGKAVIGIYRQGPCDEELTVKVRTSAKQIVEARHLNGEDGPMEEAAFAAKAGKHFESKEVDVVFGKGERLQSFEVVVKEMPVWTLAKMFNVEFVSIVSGKALLYPRKYARVFIINQFKYPAGVGEGEPTVLWAAYFREWIPRRGFKFWKTLRGLMYVPFHKVVVVSLVQKFMIDWACKPSKDSDQTEHSWYIMILAAIFMLSSLIYRWADTCWIRNKGRGGSRQAHRVMMIEKMLMFRFMDSDPSVMSDSRFLYTALFDVHSVSMNLWWQGLMLAQNSLGLVLSVLVILFLDIYKAINDHEAFNATHILPALILIFLTPLSIVLIHNRNRLNLDLALERSESDEKWIETWTSLSHSSKSSSNHGVREIHAFTKRFADESGKFIKKLVQARDWREDTSWITTWIGILSYTVILVWGGFALLSERSGMADTATLEVGQYTVLLKLFFKFGTYLAKMNRSYVLSRQGITSLKRVQEMMNLGFDDKGSPDVSAASADCRCISLKDVGFDKAEGEFGAMSMQTGAELNIPLGSLVRVKAADEASKLTVFGLIGGRIHASKGSVIVPTYASKCLLMPFPASPPGKRTVMDELLLAGAPALETRRLALALGLSPDAHASDLPPGQAKLLALAEALLRDPDILILIHPLSFVPHARQHLVASLLRLWQAGGGLSAILERLSDKSDTPNKEDSQDEQDVSPFYKAPRTVIVSESSYMAKTAHPSDMIVDLDSLLETSKYSSGNSSALVTALSDVLSPPKPSMTTL